MLQKNQSISLTIDSLSSDGNGIGHYEGMVVFVPFSVAGDVLTVKIVKVLKSHAFGIIEVIHSPGAGRVANTDCPLFRKCGGCQFRHMDYRTELLAKEQFVADAMYRLGKITAHVSSILSSPSETGYRNKVQFPLTDANGSVEAGFYAGRSHRVIPCKSCMLQPELLNQITQYICTLLEELHISIYHEDTQKGCVRHIYLRHGIHTKEVLVCLVINGNSLPRQVRFCEKLTERFSCIRSIILNSNTQKTNVILGKQCKTIFGESYICDTMCDVPIRLDPLSFYQVNTSAAEQLYRKAAELADLQAGDILLDLYCGMGTIGLSMVEKAGMLIGVEIIPQAIENAKRSAEEMGVADKCRFFSADASEAAIQLATEGLHPNVVILDPPRKGCDEKGLEAVLSMQPQRIVMVSCNPATAARDVRYLVDRKYQIRAIQPADLFPRTKHVETIILLSREETDSKKASSDENRDMSDFHKDAIYSQHKNDVLNNISPIRNDLMNKGQTALKQ